MYAQDDTENRRFNDNVALSRGIKEFIALAAGQQDRDGAPQPNGPTSWTLLNGEIDSFLTYFNS
jgi:hypothetical protein